MRTRQVVIGLAAGLIVTAGALYVGRNAVRAWAFEQTGEESLGGQVRGLGQLALNVTHPPLELEPYLPIEHTGINPYGINTFLHSEVEPEKRERQVQLISEAGFHWLREEFPWEDIEIHGPGDFIDRRNDPAGVDAWAKYDQIVDLADQYGLELIVRLSNPPSWSRSLPDEEIGAFAPPDNYDDFARYAAEVAERYKGRVTVYQVWNEPNIYPEWGEQNVSPEDYTDLLCRAYDALKAVDPDIVVVSGALAPTAELSGRDFNDYLFLQRMYDAGAGDCFDVLTMQGYMLWSGPTDRRMQPIVVNFGRNQFIRDIMVRNGDAHKPIWISEMNSNAAPEDVDPRYGRVTLDQQARWAPLAYQRAQEEWPWVGVVAFWYFKRADWQWLDEQRPEAYFQMSDPDFNLMPVYDTMKDYATRPPVVYPGYHWADHYAVPYDSGWQATPDEDGRARLATDAAGPVTFTFYGNQLRIILDPAGDPNAGMLYTLDGDRYSVDQDDVNATIWRGATGFHTVTIEPRGDLVITHYLVRNDPRIPLGLLIVVALVLGAYTVITRRRSLREYDERRREQSDEME